MRTADKMRTGIIWGIFLFPVLFLIMLAFSSAWRFPAVLPQQFNTQNAGLIFSPGGNILSSIFLSLGISAAVSCLAVITAFSISKHIAYHPKKQLFVFCAYLPFVLSPVIYAACINYFFVVLDLNGKIAGVLLAQFMIIFPYNIILFLSHWNEQMKAYQNLGATLGGNAFQRYSRVIIPLSKNILLITFFQSFLISWFEFGLTNYIGGGMVQTLTLRVYQYIGEANIHLAALSSLLLIIPPVILLWLNKRFIFHPSNTLPQANNS